MIRVITTLFLAAAVLSAIWILPLFWFQALIFLAIGVGLSEYARLVFKEAGSRCLTVLLGLGVAAVMIWFPTTDLILASLIGAVFVAFLWGMARHKALPDTTHHAGLMVLGVCYLALPLSFWCWLKGMGREWVMLCLFPAALTDTFGFLAGKSIGKRKLAPVISPNKTWEGFLAGLLGGGLFGLWLAQTLFVGHALWSWPVFVVIGLSVSIAAALGDLIESLIKRSAGVKDSSHLIPGHGGALDRLDALTFTAPLFYFWIKLLSF